VADRNPSFFGPILAIADDSPPAFGPAELARILVRRMEIDLIRRNESAFPETRRFATMRPVSGG